MEDLEMADQSGVTQEGRFSMVTVEVSDDRPL